MGDLTKFIDDNFKEININSNLNIKKIQVKTILSNSKIYRYVINSYIGCEHSCSYCYARYIKKFTNHNEFWGRFVDVKINAPILLEKEIRKKKKDKVWFSSVSDPYQPIEEKYELTRKCLKILILNNWPIVIQTRSPLILKDLNLLKQARNLEVCISVPTSNDKIRKLFEPTAPSIEKRIETIKKLFEVGIKVSVMIAPILPEADNLINKIGRIVDSVIVDKMNYNYSDLIYKKNNLEKYKTKEYFDLVKNKIKRDCEEIGLDCKVVF